MGDIEFGLDMYHRNGFRVTGLAVTADGRAIRKRRRRLGLDPIAPLVANSKLDVAFARIDSPRTRIVDELTWVWDGDVPDAEMCTLHDRVIRAHSRALDLELGGEITSDVRSECHQQWQTAMDGWAALLADDRIWNYLEMRAAAHADSNVTAVDVQEIRARIADDMLAVCARMAVERTRQGIYGGFYRDHMQAIAPWTRVEEALREAAAPVVDEIASVCAVARASDGLDAAQLVIEECAAAVTTVRSLLPGPDPLRRGACALVAARVHQLVTDAMTEMLSSGSASTGPGDLAKRRASRDRASHLLESMLEFADQGMRVRIGIDLAKLRNHPDTEETTLAAGISPQQRPTRKPRPAPSRIRTPQRPRRRGRNVAFQGIVALLAIISVTGALVGAVKSSTLTGSVGYGVAVVCLILILALYSAT